MNSFGRLFSVTIVAACSLFFCRLLAAEIPPASESFSETHAFSATGEITVINANGAVTIHTWDRAEVRIEGQKRARTAEQLKLISLGIETTPGRLSIKTKLPPQKSGTLTGNAIRPEVQLTLTVPATVKLEQIDTVNGVVSIDGVRGNIAVHTVNGPIHATGLAADARLDSVNGEIRAEFAGITGHQSISAHTVNGAATLALPGNSSFRIQATTVNGSISCDFPLRVDGEKTRTRVIGTAGDGAASLQLDTVNGKIYLTRL